MSKPTAAAPFHVMDIKQHGSHVGYALFCKNRPFLHQAHDQAGGPRLKRHEAYAVARLLNSETTLLKWAAKFSDPYVDE